jgi:hypothetical protein
MRGLQFFLIIHFFSSIIDPLIMLFFFAGLQFENSCDLVFSQNLPMPIVWLQLVVLKISTGFPLL